jgi:hypothetical protein
LSLLTHDGDGDPENLGPMLQKESILQIVKYNGNALKNLFAAKHIASIFSTKIFLSTPFQTPTTFVDM